MKSGYVANRSTRFSVLSDDQCREIVSASKEILERTGVKIFYQEAVEILRKAGCSVDGEQVRIPSRLVDQALRMVPKRVTLCNSRTGERVMHLEGYNAYFGTGSDTPFYIDPYTGERRPSSTQSVGNNCRVIDALPNLDFVMSLGISQDVPQPVYDRYQYEAMVLNTSKPIVVTANDAQGFADIIEMAEIVAGGPEKLRRNPLIVLYAEPISPLQHSMESITKLMMAANKEVPVVYTPCVMAGATVPATMAGTLACGLAESLSGLVLHQLTKEGAPFIMGGVFTIMDMQSTIFSYGAPEFHLLEAALADIAHYLNLPMFGTCGCSDSKVVDEQAGIEAAMSILLMAQAGPNLNHDVGYIEYGSTASLEMLVICDEIIGMARRIVRGIEVNPETLAVDVIDQVGPGGHFLKTAHTRKFFKTETWYPTLIDRKIYANWKSDGSKTLTQRANEKVISILESYQPEQLSPDVKQKLRAVVERAASKCQK